jgi:hypothetical protein
MVNSGVTFPESAAIPVALQPRPIWRCSAPRQVSDSVGDVFGVRLGEPTSSKEPGAPRPHQSSVQTSFKSVLSLRSLISTGRCGPCGWMLLAGWVRWVSPTRSSVQLNCPATGLTRGTPPRSGARGRVWVRSEMEACVDLFRGPRSTPWQSTGGGLSPREW